MPVGDYYWQDGELALAQTYHDEAFEKYYEGEIYNNSWWIADNPNNIVKLDNKLYNYIFNIKMRSDISFHSFCKQAVESIINKELNK